MFKKLKYQILFLLLGFACCSFAQDQKPTKEEVLESIMDINVSEEEAIEILSKYYPELLNPVVEAKKDYEQANAVQNSDEQGQYFQTMGRKFLDKRDYDQAIIYFQKAIIQKKKSQGGSEKSPDLSLSYKDLGAAYEGKKDIDEALRSYQRGIISNSSDFNDEDLLSNPESSDIISNSIAIPIFEAKGNLLLQSDNDENKLLAALISYERAIEILDLACKKYTSEYSKLNLSEQITILSEKAIQAALKLYKSTRNKQYKNRVFSIAEKGKAMILTSALLESKARELSSAPPEILRREQILKTKIAQLTQRIQSKKEKKKSIKKEETKLFALTQTLFFLQDSLKTYYPKYEYLKFAPPTIALDSLQNFLLEKNSAIVEYFFGSKYAFAFTLTGHDFHIERIEDIDQINKSVFTLREDIQSQNFKSNAEESFTTFIKNSSLIYGYALEKSLAHVDKNIDHLIIIPDGSLWLIPFELLLHEGAESSEIDFSTSNLPYLINKYSIDYISSSKLLLKNYTPNTGGTLVPFAGFAPDFNGRELAARSCLNENQALGQLGFNQAELEGIAPYFNGEIYFGPEASKKAFLNLASNADILHLSTHACLNKEDPMESRIFFANQKYITTEEIYALDINAKMTVLSACQTGLGKVYNGEGVISLARAFSQAGCPSVTMSLWPVADDATSQIMISYYENLDKGINKGAALREAKLTYLNEQPKSKQHPYYWAAFVHIGDDSPIQASTSSSMMFWLLIGGGLLLFSFFLKKPVKKKSRRR